MHRLVVAREVAEHLVGDERAERREQLRERAQALVQRRVRGRIGRLPEARPRAAHVPVREVVDELGQRLRAAERVERLERVGDRAHRAVQTASGSSGRARASAAPPRSRPAGVQPSRFAYVTKNEYVFHSVSRNWRVASSMPST